MIANPRPHPEWRLAVDTLKDAPYDAQFSHEELAAVMHLEPRSKRYYGQMQRVKKHLREHLRHIEAVTDRGYRIVRANEQQASSRRVVVQGIRRVRIGAEIGRATDVSQLTPSENAKLANHLSHCGALLAHGRSVLQKTKLGLLPAPMASTPKMIE